MAAVLATDGGFDLTHLALLQCLEEQPQRARAASDESGRPWRETLDLIRSFLGTQSELKAARCALQAAAGGYRQALLVAPAAR